MTSLANTPATSPAHSPRPHQHSEATRLLCGGAYLDLDFRRRVIDELIGHEERPVAPSLGVDVASVLAHALRARRQDAVTALALFAIWVLFFVAEGAREAPSELAGGAVLPAELYGLGAASLSYAGVCLALYAARSVAGRGTAVFAVDRAAHAAHRASRLRPLDEAAALRRILGVLATFVARGYAIMYWVFAVLTFGDDPGAVFFPLIMTGVVWAHRGRVAAILRSELGRDTFPGRPPLSLPASGRAARVAVFISHEQHAKGALYDAFRPFVGAGSPFQPWSFALELKRKDGTREAETVADGSHLTSRRVLDLIGPRLEALRESAARDSRDRLRELEFEEFVYLPSGIGRGEGVYEPSVLRQHVAEAVNEGGEARRHFLRIRVGAWDEQIVVSLLVRVHTQGGMLVLEVAPHVLGPVVEEFRDIDAIAARRADDLLRDGVRALLATPAATVAALLSAGRSVIQVFRIWLANPAHALPDGPLNSVREMGSTEEVSLFQQMDISRYVKTVQDRIESGVRDALESQGYETDRFEQQVVQIREGGVFINTMAGGAVATGPGAQATHTQGRGGDER